jgi:hypothetical protein
MSQTSSTPGTQPARDAGHWAADPGRLRVGGVPAEAINLNVEGRQLTGPLRGFGPMWQKTYTIPLPAPGLTPAAVIQTWKDNFPRFWPPGNRFYAPLTGVNLGDVAVLNLAMPGGMKLSTGIMVIYADEEAFTFMTPEGHMLAAWITFSASAQDGVTVAQAQALLRASDPATELGLRLFGHRQEDRFWQQTLRNLAAHFGVDAQPAMRQVCVDPRVQWRYAGNVFKSSVISSSLYMLGAPWRALRRRGRP